MFAARQRFVFLLIAGLCLEAYGAPVEEQQEETDPELTAGYFQGDMDVDFQRNGEIATTRHWPNATVHYKIDEAFNTEQTEHIKLGMHRIELVSCIRFVPATPETLDYVLVTVSETGCSSKVGYLGGEQTIKLKPNVVESGCFRLGTIEHELLHTLGFHHQQCSSDRDEYVKIIEENIIDGKESNFKKYEANRLENFDVKYDYGSVLHYGAQAFSRNGEATIVALQPQGKLQMGQRLALSEADIKRLNTMYKCPLQL